MKKLLVLLIAIVVLVAVSACGKVPEAPSDEKESAAESSKTETEESVADAESQTEASSADEETKKEDGEEKPENHEENNSQLAKKPAKNDESTETSKSSGKTTVCSHDYAKATCKKPKTCTKCGATDGSIIGHSWDDWTTEVEAAVGKVGIEKRSCSVCQKIDKREIAALPQPADDTTKKWFISQYSIAKQQYINEINEIIDEKQEKIDELREEGRLAAEEYNAEEQRLKKLPASETRDVWLRALQQKRYNEAQDRTKKINAIESEINELKAKIAAPDADSVLTIMAKNCNISSIEIYEYYYKYADSVS